MVSTAASQKDVCGFESGPGTFLCRVCTISLCLHGLSLGSLGSFHVPKTCIRSIMLFVVMNLSVSGCFSLSGL